jgi:hypothetical protein
MRLSRLSIVAGVGFIFFAPTADAQPPARRPAPPLESAAGSDQSAAKTEAELAREGRRAQARALLFNLSGEARGFRDQTLRARSLARIADALWGVAAEQARALFREAWEAAERADEEGRGSLNLRHTVLAMAARRDRQLAEEFLQKLTAAREETDAAPSGHGSPSGTSLWELPAAQEQRLSLAENLLGTGDVKSALQFADPVLGRVTISTLEFLTQLREKDAPAADRRYAAMLANTAGNPLADANTVSLLSSYIFTPRLYVIFNRAGGHEASSMRTSYPQAAVDPPLRLAFFQVARAVLLRPPPPPEQDHSTAGVAGKYMVLRRLLPLFEQYAPREIAAAVRGHFEALNSQVSDGLRQGEDEWVGRGVRPESPPAERERSLLEDIERARTSDERDQLYFKLALHALGRDDAAARDHAGKIEETSFRRMARAWVDWSLVISAIEKKKVEAALELARGGELTPVQKVWVWTRAAKLLAETDRDKASALLDDAMAEARRIDRADADRPRALLAVAGALRLFEPSRAWDALSDAVEAANAAEGFTGEGGALTITVNSRTQILRKTEAVPEFNVAGVFGEAAHTDFDRAVQTARGFKAEAPRVNAVISASRSVLHEPDASAPAARPAAKK